MGRDKTPSVDLTDPLIDENLTRQVVEGFGGVWQPPYVYPPKGRYPAITLRSAVVGDADRARSGAIDYLSVTRHGRFGNNYVQLIHAVALARRLNIPHIHHNFRHFRRARTVEGLRLTSQAPGNGLAGLEARFFWRRSWPMLEDLSPKEFVDISDSLIRPSFTVVGKPGGGVLALNLRGGKDLFGQHKPPGGYGQPPLSYYVAAAETVMRRWPITRLDLLPHDGANPVTEGLVNWLAQCGKPFRVVTKGPRGDLRALLSADHIVMGETTFTPAAALLSKRLISLTSFDYRLPFLGPAVDIAIPERIAFSDPSGGYSVTKRWEGTAAQRDEMCAYPASNLTSSAWANQPGRASGWAGKVKDTLRIFTKR